MKESIITTAEALRLCVGVSTVEIILAVAILIVVLVILKKFYEELQAMTKAMDRETYQRYLVASGRANVRTRERTVERRIEDLPEINLPKHNPPVKKRSPEQYKRKAR